MVLPCINPNLETYKELNGKMSVFDKKTGKTFVLGKNEYNVLNSLDGTKSLEEISSKSIYSLLEMSALIEQFETLGFIKGKETKQKLNLIKIKKPLINGNRLINSKNFVWKTISFLLVYFSFPVLLIGITTNLSNFSNIFDTMERNLFTPSMLLFIPITLFMLSLHELGHAVVARCMNVNVPEIGIMLYWFMPCAYTNLSGITFLEKRTKRILCLLAGILVNIFLTGLGLILLNFVSENTYNFMLWFSLSNISIILMNFLVFLKLDGYFLLEELLSLKGLRTKSFNFVKVKISENIASLTKKKIKTKYFGVILESDQSLLDDVIFVLYVLFSCLYIPIILLSIGISIFNLILR